MVDTLDAAIGARIADIRKQWCMSQGTLGLYLEGSGIRSLADVERGVEPLSIRQLYRVAEELRCTVHDLLPTARLLEQRAGVHAENTFGG